MTEALLFHAICQNQNCGADLRAMSRAELNGMACPRCGATYVDSGVEGWPQYDKSVEPNIV